MNVGIANFAAINSKKFICKFSSFSDHFPQLTSCCKRLANLILKDLFVSLNMAPFALVIFHCLILNFPPTKEVLVLTDCLILSLPGMDRLGLVIIFVVAVNTLAVDKLAELLGQLKTLDLSILLILKHWFEGEKGDSGISKLPFLSIPLLVPNSWCGYLFLGLKTPFVVMVSELIFSDL